MPTLAELQKQFQAALNQQDETICHHIQISQRLSAKQHLNIYRSSTVGALQKVLQDIFPVCEKLTGKDFFLHSINQYIAKTPAHSPDIGDYGATFPQFLATFQPALTLPYLADVAKLEWAWHKIFTAPPSPIFDFQQLAECYTQAGEKIIFHLNPMSTLLTSPYPIHQIWQMNQADAEESQQLILLPEQNYYLLVWPHALTQQLDLLQKQEWYFLTWCQEQFTFGEIYAKFTALFPALNLEEVLSHLIQQGWITDFTVASQP